MHARFIWAQKLLLNFSSIFVDGESLKIYYFYLNLQEAQNASFVTCNSEQMVHERVQADEEEDYVYDLYYTNSRDFNLQLLESSLSIHPSSEHLLEYANNEEEEYEVYEDEDDENEECNWRNDYPDEDPRFFDNEDVDYIYGNGN